MAGFVLGGAAVVALVACLVAYRKVRQRAVARAIAISSADGIDEGRYVRAGGVDQWIRLRGADRANPILLVLAGAGLPMEPFVPTLRAWERHFTVVLWDRRDVGRTRARNGKAGNESWTVSTLADDGIEVVEFVRRRLGQDKVVLFGHSQGSMVGVTMAARRPDLVHAYVGAGQMADMVENERVTHGLAVERARAAGNRKALKALERAAPPYTDRRTWVTKQRWSMATDPTLRAWQRSLPALALTWPGYSLADVYRSLFGVLFLPPGLFTAAVSASPSTLGTRFEIPFFVLHGDADQHTLPGLAESYVSAIDAPHKEFVRLPGAGHLGPLTHPDLYLAELLARVRPLATAP
ncbi:alpha/beta fold hydrolase [Asanoa iriomotensis]|uniref:Proline iminopeptidase n=1 Tax=Asanoa iriomotensis TaxID=234613 RepID=A0ABQ4BXL5_9ACTN|nr:alpha/beta fold hydrolase [Asanoa iriomotensis]GIF55284.1 proline iminopeptidase [Asanoa iriomotensis]